MIKQNAAITDQYYPIAVILEYRSCGPTPQFSKRDQRSALVLYAHTADFLVLIINLMFLKNVSSVRSKLFLQADPHQPFYKRGTGQQEKEMLMTDLTVSMW